MGEFERKTKTPSGQHKSPPVRLKHKNGSLFSSLKTPKTHYPSMSGVLALGACCGMHSPEKIVSMAV